MPRLCAIAAVIWFALLCGLLAGGCVSPAKMKVTIHGHVLTEEGTAVSAALVRFGEMETLSSEHGSFQLIFLNSCADAAGVHLVEIQAKGFEPLQTEFSVKACNADTASQDLRLTLVPATHQ